MESYTFLLGFLWGFGFGMVEAEYSELYSSFRVL